MQNAARSYFQTQVTTTTQGDILIMLYDGAIKFLRQAQEKIQAKDYAQKGILISKAMDILSELQGSLNATKGGELAVNLQKLYFFCNSRLLSANLNMDVATVEEVIRILTGLRDAYNQINAQYGGTVPSLGQHASGRPAPAPGRPLSQAATPTGPSPVPTATLLPVPPVQAATPAVAPRAPLATAASRVVQTPAPVQTAPTSEAFRSQSILQPVSMITPTAAPVRRAAAAYAANRT